MTGPKYITVIALAQGALLWAGCSRDVVGQDRPETDAAVPSISLDALVVVGGGGVSGTDDARGSASDAGDNPGSTPGLPTLITNHCPTEAIDAGCVGAFYDGQALGLDIFIMFDQSGSMATKDDGTTMRMDAVRGAIAQFLSAPESEGLGVGIGYFGTQPLSCACTSCRAEDYAEPAVAIGDLPGNAPALISSLTAAEPTGETPTGAAIRGACSYARQLDVAAARAGRAVVILLVTDGEPQAPRTSATGACAPTLQDAVAAARECLGVSSGLRTFVLGVGPSLGNLNQIAAAGGTNQAYLVESGGGPEILQALNRIRNDARIPCTLQLPQTTGATLDLNTVNLVYTDAGCATTTLGMVPDLAGCASGPGGWYYDDPTQPRSIRLCGASCEQVSAPGGRLAISVGCRTQVVY